MRKRVILSAIAAGALSLGALSGCFMMKVSVTSIEKTGSSGLEDYYTITYSDGSTSGFTVTNGKDGANAQQITVEDVYETYKDIYGDELTYKQFCEKFLSVYTQSNDALNACLRSCLKVYTVFHETKYEGYRRVTAETAYCGSSVIYKMDDEYTYLLTNFHVIYDDKAAANYSNYAEKIWAYLYGSESSPVQDETTLEHSVTDDYAIVCEYVGGSVEYDVAVIRAKTEDVKKVNPDVVPVSVNLHYNVGDNTYAVGNPDNGGISVTEGIVSVDSEYITLNIDGTTRAYRSIRTDTAITHGSSGGGLFNMNGELIGLNNAGDSEIASMNYAIPAKALTGVADGIIYYNQTNGAKATKKALIGVTSQSLNSRYVYDAATGNGVIREDVSVTAVNRGSIADALGIAVGDVLVSVTLNGVKTEISRQYQISDLLLGARVGNSIKLGYMRGGKAYETEEFFVRSADLSDIK